MEPPMLTTAQRESAIEALSRMMVDSSRATSGLLDRLEVFEAELAAKLRELDARGYVELSRENAT